MRKSAAAIGILLLAAVMWYFFAGEGKKPETPRAGGPSQREVLNGQTAVAALTKKEEAKVAAAVSQSNGAVPAQAIVASNVAGVSNINASQPDIPPEIVLENVRRAVRQYGEMFGGNPVGTNPEITRALNGNNPKQIVFINTQAGMRIDDKGEMIDPWGTPFFFHQISGREMEIHSAGPDKIMWTADDLVVR